MPAFEDEHGTYIMNAKDLRAVQHVERLTRMGVHSLKIEGRTKSHFYCARTTQVYRRAIDDAVAGREFDRSLMTDLESLAQRGYTEGFLRRHVHDEYQNYQNGSSVSERQQFVGELTGERREGLAEVKVKNRFGLGDHLELMTPAGNFHFDLRELQSVKGEAIEVAPGGWAHGFCADSGGGGFAVWVVDAGYRCCLKRPLTLALSQRERGLIGGCWRGSST
jgi:putative protease